MTAPTTARARVAAAQDPRLFTLDEVAGLWRVSPRTVRRRVEAGDLRTVDIAGRGERPILRIPADEVARFVARNTH